eukprot:363346-Chlamydomonas_euryale.AAC.3
MDGHGEGGMLSLPPHGIAAEVILRIVHDRLRACVCVCGGGGLIRSLTTTYMPFSTRIASKALPRMSPGCQRSLCSGPNPNLPTPNMHSVLHMLHHVLLNTFSVASTTSGPNFLHPWCIHLQRFLVTREFVLSFILFRKWFDTSFGSSVYLGDHQTGACSEALPSKSKPCSA